MMMNIRVAITLLLAAISVGQAQTPTKTWDGFVTDTHCGTNCQRTSAMTPDRACVRLCVRKGSKYGLWYGNHVYALEPQSKAARFAAVKVHVVGELSNDVITITSIAPIHASPAPESQVVTHLDTFPHATELIRSATPRSHLHPPMQRSAHPPHSGCL